MTEHQSASQINPFKSLSKTSTSGGNQSGGPDVLSFADNSFSRELSRASQRSMHSAATEQRHGDHSPDRGVHKPHESVERSRSSDSREIDRAENRPTRSESARGNLSAVESRVDKASAEQRNRAVEKTRQISGERDAQKDNESAIVDNSSGNELISRQDDGKTAVAADEVSTEQQMPVATQMNTSTDSGSEGGQPIGPQTGSPLLQEVQATAEESGVQGNRTISWPDQSASANNAQADAAVARENTALKLVDSLGGQGSDSPLPTAQQLMRGEQLSPVQLASRQAHQAGKAVNREQQSVDSLATVNAENLPEANAPLTHAPIGNARATLARGQTGMALVGSDTDVTDDSVLLTKPVLLNGAVVDERAEPQSFGRLQQADLQAVANLDQKMVAEKLEHQALAANLAQNRQQDQQQIQNMAQLTASPATLVSDSSTQATDNMFLSLPGGIVTAPVLQRAETGSNPTINTPTNMPILQNDADKAMASNIRWMVTEGVKSAVVNVTPSGMGPISVTIGIEKEQMNVSIIALQGSTREALDSLLPRLREQLAAQGHDSVKVDVSDGRADHSDRGYGHNFSREQHSSDSDSQATANRVVPGESDSRVSEEKNTSTSPSQGLLVVNNDGQIRSSYDVYV